MPDSILVTGGAGFAGSALAVALKHNLPTATVSALDNLHRRGSELNLLKLRENGIRFIHGDIRELNDVLEVRPDPDLIIECSAEPSAQAGYRGSANYLIATNLTGCFNCMELARRAHADFIFISTSRVYPFARLNAVEFVESETRFSIAAQQELPGVSAKGISEEFSLEGPRSLYGMTKLAAELLVEEYAAAYGLRYVIDRFSLLTGPGQMAKLDQGIIALWVAAHVFHMPLSYIGFGGTGKQVRDVLHIDDFCDLIIDQVVNLPLYSGRRFNIGGGVERSISLIEATALCEAITGNAISIGEEPETRPADVRLYISNNDSVISANDWQPRRGLQEIFADIFKWLRVSERELRPLFFPRS